MRFKLDENLPAPAAGLLTRAGYDAGTVTGDGLQGVPDPDVVAAAAADGRVLITLDQGMGDIRAYPPGSHAGIVVLRLADQSATTVIRAINDLASLAQPGSLPRRRRNTTARTATNSPPMRRTADIRNRPFGAVGSSLAQTG